MKFEFSTDTLQENLANIDVVKMEGSKDGGNDFIALKPTVKEQHGEKLQFMKFAACNLSVQVDSYGRCSYMKDENEIVDFMDGETYYVPRRFIEACKCITADTVIIDFEDTTISIVDTQGNRIPFPVLNQDKHVLIVPDVTEINNPSEHPLVQKDRFAVMLKAESLVDGLSTFGAISGSRKMGEYTLEGVGGYVDPATSSLHLMSSNNHVFRKGGITYTNFTNNENKNEPVEFILPQEVNTFLRAAAYEDAYVSLRVKNAILVVIVNTTMAYFRLKQEKYVPMAVFDNFLGGNTLASCEVDANEFISKLKLLEVSASSEELVDNLLGLEIEIQGNSVYLRNPKSPKTKISLKAENCSGEEKIYVNGTELAKLMPRAEKLSLEICSANCPALKINGYHVMLPLSV